jgi:UDP-glucose 4-epimerase
MTNPGKYFRNNTVGTLNLLEAMREAGVGTIVFSSTCATYGNPVRVPIDEAHPQAPVNPYGESKLMVEKTTAVVRQDSRLALDGAPVFQRRGC